MMIAKTFFDRLGIKKLKLNINSIGCRECRKNYNAALKEYLRSKLDKMCPTCRERFEKNPLRILDCKEEGCRAITAGAPVILDYLCDDCRAHHESVCAQLTKLGIDFEVNPHIVRGLDYYTRTVFEFISSDIGAQGTVSGGGRYNDLIEDVGGKPCPAVGFGMGLERLILTMEALGLPFGEENVPDVYIAPLCEEAKDEAMLIADKLRHAGISCDTDIVGRSFKAQLKYVNKTGARYMIVIGTDEIASAEYQVKNLLSGESEKVAKKDLVAYLTNAK